MQKQHTIKSIIAFEKQMLEMFYNFSRPSLLRNSFSKNRGMALLAAKQQAMMAAGNCYWRAVVRWRRSVCRSVAQSVGKMVHHWCCYHGTFGLTVPDPCINIERTDRTIDPSIGKPNLIIESMQLLVIVRATLCRRYMTRVHFCS